MESVNKFWNPKTKLIIVLAGFATLGLISILLFFQVNNLNNSLIASLDKINRFENETQDLFGDISETSISSSRSIISSTETVNNSSSSLASSSNSIGTNTSSLTSSTSSLSLVGEKGEKGDKGDTGAQGLQGIQGIPGISGYERLCGNSITIPTGSSGSAGANCSEGKKLISFFCDDVYTRAYLSGQISDSANASVLCRWINASGLTAIVKACVMCGYIN